MNEPGSVLAVGVGSGLGASLCRRFAGAGHAVAMAARDAGKLAPIAEGIAAAGGTARTYAVDGTDEPVNPKPMTAARTIAATPWRVNG